MMPVKFELIRECVTTDYHFRDCLVQTAIAQKALVSVRHLSSALSIARFGTVNFDSRTITSKGKSC